MHQSGEDDPWFFENITNMVKEHNNSDLCIWGGDFNKCLNLKDKLGTFTTSKSAELINEFLVDFSWVDIWQMCNLEIQQYTWFRRRPRLHLD